MASPLGAALPVKAGLSSSVTSGSLDVTFLSELLLMLAVQLQLGLCSGLTKEGTMTRKGSATIGQTKRWRASCRVLGGGHLDPTPMASSQSKAGRRGSGLFAHTSGKSFILLFDFFSLIKHDRNHSEEVDQILD